LIGSPTGTAMCFTMAQRLARIPVARLAVRACGCPRLPARPTSVHRAPNKDRQKHGCDNGKWPKSRDWPTSPPPPPQPPNPLAHSATGPDFTRKLPLALRYFNARPLDATKPTGARDHDATVTVTRTGLWSTRPPPRPPAGAGGPLSRQVFFMRPPSWRLCTRPRKSPGADPKKKVEAVLQWLLGNCQSR
jgi:hypothetical protein